MTRSTLEELLARCEAADGGDDEIDAMLYGLAKGLERNDGTFCVIDKWQFRHPTVERAALYVDAREVPSYTSSIDAIVGLIEREFPGSVYSAKTDFGGYCGAHLALDLPGERPGPYFNTQCETVPLSLCAAFIRAKLSSGGDE